MHCHVGISYSGTSRSSPQGGQQGAPGISPDSLTFLGSTTNLSNLPIFPLLVSYDGLPSWCATEERGVVAEPLLDGSDRHVLQQCWVLLLFALWQ